MKKQVAITLLLSAMAVSSAFCKTVYIDVQELFRSSKEGKTLLTQNEKDKESLFSLEYKESQKINEFREIVEKDIRAGKLKESAIEEKQIEMGQMQKTAKRALEDKKEALELQTQRRMISYKGKIFGVAQKVLEKEGWSAVKDKSAPGIVCVAKGAERTQVILKALNEKYDKDRAQAAVSRNKSA